MKDRATRKVVERFLKTSNWALPRVLGPTCACRSVRAFVAKLTLTTFRGMKVKIQTLPGKRFSDQNVGPANAPQSRVPQPSKS